MSARSAVAGASVHYARAELVALSGSPAAPVLLDRRSVALIDDGLPIAPYHHEALVLDLRAATELVARVRRSVEQRAGAAIAALVADHRASALILPASPYERLPGTLSEILASRALTNAADGMLYREALAEAAADAGLDVVRYARGAEPEELAAEALGTDVSAVRALVARLGREAGPPWRKDHKLAAAAALSVLGRRRRR